MANSMAVFDMLMPYLAEIQYFFNSTGSTSKVEPNILPVKPELVKLLSTNRRKWCLIAAIGQTLILKHQQVSVHGSTPDLGIELPLKVNLPFGC